MVGLDAHQRPDSRGGPEGEGQGRQSGSPEGPESRPGPPSALGGKLPGESERWWSSVLHLFDGLKCDLNVTLVAAEARQPRRGFLLRANYQ